MSWLITCWRHGRGRSAEKRKSILDSAKTTNLPLTEKVPVYLFYMTVWLDENAKPQFRNDLYGLDDALIKVIQKVKT